MIIEIKVPSPGESISEVELGDWLVKDGDIVNLDSELVEINSDKATLTVNASAAGQIKILIASGETVKIGDVIAKIDTEKQSSVGSQQSAVGSQQSSVGSQQSSVGSQQSSVGSQQSSVGSQQSSVGSQQSSVGSQQSSVSNKNSALDNSASLSIKTPQSEILIGIPSPSAEKLMAEHGLIAAMVPGTGKDGRINKEDVLAFIASGGKEKNVVAEKKNAEEKSTEKKSPEEKNTEEKSPEEKNIPATKENPTSLPPTPPTESSIVNRQSSIANPESSIVNRQSSIVNRIVRRQKLSMLRRSLADRLVAVKNQTAMLTTFNEVDMHEIMALRTKYKDKFKEKHGTGLGFMSFFAKACTEALATFQAVNAQIEGKEIVYFDYVDLGIAVSSDRGLVVPVIRNAEALSLAGIETAIRDLAIKAREGAITIEDMTGGTFTITNGGVFGSMLSTPILNPPQSAILGMHNIVERPVAMNGQVVIRPIMYVALSYDHRIIDGKEAVSFLFRVKELLEDPSRMLLEI